MLPRILPAVLLWVANACVVSDQIEFSEQINMPPTLVRAEPATDTFNAATRGDSRTFFVTVWDPDENDADRYGGQGVVYEQLSSGKSHATPFPCEKVPLEESNADEYDGGVLVTFSCETAMPDDAAISETMTVIVEVEVSDRDFAGVDERRQTVQWVLELRPKVEN